METIKLEYDYKKNEEKRLYVKGKISNIICPSCKKETSYRFDPTMGEYLSYPENGKKTSIYFCCNNCEEDIEIPIKIKDIIITIEVDKTKVKIQ
jgi:hypothetical protein